MTRPMTGFFNSSLTRPCGSRLRQSIQQRRPLLLLLLALRLPPLRCPLQPHWG